MKILQTASTNVKALIAELFPSAIQTPLRGFRDAPAYRVDENALDVLNGWGRRQNIKIQNFIGNWGHLKEVFVRNDVVIGTMKSSVYVLSTRGYQKLITAIDLADTIADAVDRHAEYVDNDDGLFGAIRIEADKTQLKGISQWLADNPQMAAGIKVRVADNFVEIMF